MSAPAILLKNNTTTGCQFLPFSHSNTKIVEELHVQFTAALIHEVRNPLTNINLAIEMLESSMNGNDLKIYLDIIRRSSIRINALIYDLLNYHPLEPAQIEKHSIHQLLDEVLDMAADRIRLKEVTVLKDYAENDREVAFNRKKMFIGLTNIVVNAVDAMTKGKGELKIITKSIGGKHILQIEDNGCGISKENLENIAKPHFTNKPGGLGIGLAAAYNILQENHVGVNVESELGKGTRFIFSFAENNQYGIFKKIQMN